LNGFAQPGHLPAFCLKCDNDGQSKLEDDDQVQNNAHGHSFGHERGHGHVFTPGQLQSQLASDASQDEYGHGHAICDGQGHGHAWEDCTPECGHDCCTPSQLAQLRSPGQTPHGSPHLCASKCCPTIFDSSTYGEVRLNAHCDFDGHCIQLKNTFIHVQCSHSDSDNEDCMVCKITRSRSCDSVHRTRPRIRSDKSSKRDSQETLALDSEPPGLPPSVIEEEASAIAAVEDALGQPPSPRAGESRGRRMRRQNLLVQASEATESPQRTIDEAFEESRFADNGD